MKQVLSVNGLQNLLASVKGATFATVSVATEPKMRKTNNPYVGQIVKMTRMNVVINFIYANSVNNQRVKEGNSGDFVPHPRKWGARIPGTPLVEHNGNFYLECKPNGKPQSVEYFNVTTGQPIDKSELMPFLQESNSNAEHQGVEKEIIVRDIKISNIREININRRDITIVNR